ncbi:MAG: class B sortase [Clostridia bacterium]|nr:class B sortase [Clostridia bacterium]
MLPLPEETTAPVSNMLPAVQYPDNPMLIYTEPIRKLKRTNEDIVGWLAVPELLETPVVLRDNSYYLRRDYQGRRNTNGCIFMDENVNLRTRPYLLMLFGHNMKTEEMFGFLHRYSDYQYFRKHALMDFNTQYEDGKYVAVATANVEINQVNLYTLYTTSKTERQRMIDRLLSLSEVVCPVEVKADDQLLVLVTCTGSDHYRRIVIARRLRDGETEAEIQKQLANVYPR